MTATAWFYLAFILLGAARLTAWAAKVRAKRIYTIRRRDGTVEQRLL